MFSLFKSIIVKRIIFLFIFFSFVSNASVVMTGTRVIFNSSFNEKIIQFKNPDLHPYIIQSEITTYNKDSDTNVPFVLIPPVFRIEPQTGQSVRLIANRTENLPKDKESIFYLKFTQIPSLKGTEQNRLVIAVTSKLKVFYRPDSIKGKAIDAYKYLKFNLKDGSLIVHNPTGFYITIREAKIKVGKKSFNIKNPDMVSPKSDLKWSLPSNMKTLKGASLEMIMVNDYGSDYKYEWNW